MKFRRTALCAIATAGALALLPAGSAQADPHPVPVCSPPANVTAQLRVTVCTDAWRNEDDGRRFFQADVQVINIGTTKAVLALRADLLTGTGELYGDTCSVTLAPKENTACGGIIVTGFPPGPFRTRARVQQGSYVEYFYSPYYPS